MSMRVVLPDPEGPMTPTYSPGAIVRSTPLSARTSASPMANVLVTRCRRTIGAIASLQLDFVTLGETLEDLHLVAVENAGTHRPTDQVRPRGALDDLDQHRGAVVQQRRLRHDQGGRADLGDDIGVAGHTRPELVDPVEHRDLDLERGDVLLAIAQRRDLAHPPREDPPGVRVGANAGVHADAHLRDLVLVDRA